MYSRRVVVTGIGIVSPLGLTVSENWQNLISSKSGISLIDTFDTSNFTTKIAGLIRSNDGSRFIPENYVEPKEIKRMDPFIQYGVAASIEAIQNSGWVPQTDEQKERTGVILGSGIGGLEAIEKSSISLKETGRITPFFIPSCLINLLSGHVSMKFDFRGPNHSVVTACATGAHAIGDAARLIKYGDADVMIAGGAESPVTNLGLAGFSVIKSLSKNNDNPTRASRPWDKDRDGFVMAEGSAVLVLEEYEHAKKRGAEMLAEIVGYGLAGDAYHITSPHPEGRGAKLAMKQALKDAKISTEDIGYINAHGTSTPVGDLPELLAVQNLFGEDNKNLKMSSTKSMTGHLLGAAGSLEAAYTILALRNQIVPPTINLDNPVDEAKIDLVPHFAKDHKFEYAMSNSFGFGGTNTSLILKKI
jgi:3-oxoacyl-[acyl-carrier-protein] synthase II